MSVYFYSGLPAGKVVSLQNGRDPYSNGCNLRFVQLRHGLSRIYIGGCAVVRKHVGLHLTQIVTRREKTEYMA